MFIAYKYTMFLQLKCFVKVSGLRKLLFGNGGGEAHGEKHNALPLLETIKLIPRIPVGNVQMSKMSKKCQNLECCCKIELLFFSFQFLYFGLIRRLLFYCHESFQYCYRSSGFPDDIQGDEIRR